MRKATSAGTTKLARLRIAANLGQRELAEAAGVNIRQIQSFESGKRNIGGAALRIGIRIADALGVHPRELL